VGREGAMTGAAALLPALGLVSLLSASGCAPALAVEESPAEPDAYLEEVLANPLLRKSSGEGFAWHFAVSASEFLMAYEAYENPQWLVAAARYYDWAIENALREDPDGFPGFFGGPFDDNEPGSAPVIHDTLVGDALVCEVLVRWCELIEGEPELAVRFASKRDAYVALARRMCWDKINARGSYQRDRLGYGSYRTFPRGIDVATGEWVRRGRSISDNLNKHYTNATVLVRLWRLTGDAAFRKRAVEVFSRHKAMLRGLAGGERVAWNFWMPHGDYDISGHAPRSWVAVHPRKSGYQRRECQDFVEAYDSGLVFDRTDLERMIRSNHWMLENGWLSADGHSRAGTLWFALARMAPELQPELRRRLSRKKGRIGTIQRAYYEKLIRSPDPWKRRFVESGEDPLLVSMPLQPGQHLVMAMAVPDTVQTSAGRTVRLATAMQGPGALRIELWDAEQSQQLGVLARRSRGPAERYFAPIWDGRHPETGELLHGRFTVRWQLGEEVRTWPVWVESGAR
jgi:hypothetical protein